MSRKHTHRADNAPASRRYVRSVVQRARDEILAAVVHSPSQAFIASSWPVSVSDNVARYTGLGAIGTISVDDPQVQARLERYAGPKVKES